MSDTRMNRRDVMKKGTVGVGAFGFAPSPVMWRSTDADELDRIRTAPEVQSILEELEITEFPQRAEEAELTIASSTVCVATKVEFDFGTLYFGDFDGETSAGFEFATSTAREIPSQPYRNVPSAVDAWLVGLDDGTIFIRTATENERAAILSQIPVSESADPHIYTGSNVDGFQVDVVQRPEEFDDSHRYDQLQPQLEAIQHMELTTYHIDIGDSAGGECTAERGRCPTSAIQIATDDVTVDRITTQGIVDDVTDLFGDLGAVAGDCGNPIVGCISAIGVSIFGCGRCVPVCVSGPTGVGAVLCIGCVYLFCDWLLTGIACVGPGGAMDCLETHGYI